MIGKAIRCAQHKAWARQLMGKQIINNTVYKIQHNFEHLSLSHSSSDYAKF